MTKYNVVIDVNGEEHIQKLPQPVCGDCDHFQTEITECDINQAKCKETSVACGDWKARAPEPVVTEEEDELLSAGTDVVSEELEGEDSEWGGDPEGMGAIDPDSSSIHLQ